MFLGVKAVIAKSMARIHKDNLINHGIVPMVFADPVDYDKLELSDDEVGVILEGGQLRYVQEQLKKS